MDGLALVKHKVRNRRILVSQERTSERRAVQAAARGEQVGAMLRRERVAFAAKVRGARAILGWSQREFGLRVSMTQKSIYRMEQGTHDLRRSTMVIVEQVLKAEGIDFEELPGGGFKVVVAENTLSNLEQAAMDPT